jgi:pimeloyl-ACP methyl ester carboxylesterase
MLNQMRAFAILSILASLPALPGSPSAWSSPTPGVSPGAHAGDAGPQASTDGSPAQAAAFKVFIRGVQIGTEQATVSRSGSDWVISSTSTVGPPMTVTLRRAEIRYTSDWQPLSIALEGTFRDQRMDVQTTFAGTEARSRVLQDGSTVEKSDPVSPGAVALPNHFFAAYTGLAVRLERAAPGSEVRTYVAPRAEIGVLLESVGEQRLQTAGRSFVARRYRVAMRNPGATLTGEVWAEPGGRLVRFSLPSVSLDVVREDVASVAARVQTLHRDGDEDARIPAAGFSLAATISRPPPAAGSRPAPATARPEKERWPAIVLVAGSNAMDRDEVVTGIPLFGHFASALADAGFLVVRYDRRGVGQSGGRPESATMQDYADDVRAVVRYLADRRDVDPKRIAVVGHGDGAWIAMLAASREKKVGRLVLLSAPSTGGGDLVLAQQRQALDRGSFSEAEKQAKIELQKKIHHAVLTGGGWEDIPPELRKQADTPWFASFLAFDPARVVPRLSQPVLIVQGELDRTIGPDSADKLAALARARKKSPGEEVAKIPGANYLLVPATPREITEYTSLTGATPSPDVTSAVTTWLARES